MDEQGVFILCTHTSRMAGGRVVCLVTIVFSGVTSDPGSTSLFFELTILAPVVLSHLRYMTVVDCCITCHLNKVTTAKGKTCHREGAPSRPCRTADTIA